MHQSELSSFQDFLLGLPVVEDFILSYFSKKFDYENIAINTSSLVSQSLICQFDKKNAHHISIKEYLQLVVQQWKKELQYEEEVLNCKDQIIELFNNLCQGALDEKTIKLIREYRQQIVELLLIKTDIEKKQIAGKFCKRIMNGFEIEVLSKIDYFSKLMLWKSHTTPFPQGLIEFIMHAFNKEVIEALNEESLAKASTQIVQYMETFFSRLEVRANDNIKENELKILIDNIHFQRKRCVLVIERLGKFDQVIKNERENIEFIIVKTNARDFLKTAIPFSYEILMLDSVDNEINWNEVARNLPKGLQRLYVDSAKNYENKSDIEEAMKYNCIKTNELVITFKGDKAQCDDCICGIINNIKIPFYLSIKNSSQELMAIGAQRMQESQNEKNKASKISLEVLDYRLNIQINDGNLELLAKAIEKVTPKMSELIVDLRGNKILHDQTEILIKLQKENPNYNLIYDNAELRVEFEYNNEVKQMEKLQCDLALLKNDALLSLNLNSRQKNYMREKNLSKVLEIIAPHACQIACFDFDLGKSKKEEGIQKEEIENVAKAVKNMKNIISLNLNLAYNNIQNEGVTIIAQALEELNNIVTLDLNFAYNNIGKDATVDIVHILKGLNNLSNISLNFDSNKIEQNGAIQIAQTLERMHNISSIRLNFRDNNIGKVGTIAIAQALKHLQNISVLDLNLIWNNIETEGATEIANSLQNFKQLLTLELKLMATFIGPEAIVQISLALIALQQTAKNLSTLNLNLGYMHMGDSGVKLIANALANFKMPNMKLQLNLMENNIGDSGATAIADTLKQLRNISKLELIISCNNFITIKGKSEIEQLKNIFPDIHLLIQRASKRKRRGLAVSFMINICLCKQLKSN